MYPENVKTRRGRVCMVAAAGAACLLLAFSLTRSAFAYMTDRETKGNVFTIGEVKADITETKFPTKDVDPDGIPGVPDDCELLVPYEEIPKDPFMSNTGVNDAILFMKVTVPAETLTQIFDDGTRGEEGLNDIFWLKQESDPASLHQNHFDDSWIELSTLDQKYVDGVATNTEKKGKVYLFGYKVCVAAGQKTTPLFGKIQNKKYGSRTITANEVQNILVEGYAIQADEIMLDPAIDTTKPMSEADLTKIYTVFFNQNKDQMTPGAVTGGTITVQPEATPVEDKAPTGEYRPGAPNNSASKEEVKPVEDKYPTGQWKPDLTDASFVVDDEAEGGDGS